jgi:hypothetical protein
VGVSDNGAFPAMAELPREFGFAVSAAHSDFNGDGGLPERCVP